MLEQCASVFLVAILIAVPAGATEVYRWVDANGQAHYSDQWQPGAEKIRIADSPGFSTPQASQGGNAGSPAAQASRTTAGSPYESLEIARPPRRRFFGTSKVNSRVSVRVTPALQPGDDLRLYLDGKQQEVPEGSTEAQLKEVFRGAHTLKAEVVNEAGTVLIESPTISFAVRQTSTLNPVAARDSLTSASPPGPAAILDSLTTAIAVVTTDGYVCHLNAAAESLLGVSSNQARERHLPTLLPELAPLGPLIERACASGQTYGHEFDMRPVYQQGEVMRVTGRATPVRGERGTFVILELIDATQWRHIDREKALIMQHDASRRVIYQLAHEIRNPLGGLRGAAQLLERQLSNRGAARIHPDHHRRGRSSRRTDG